LFAGDSDAARPDAAARSSTSRLSNTVINIAHVGEAGNKPEKVHAICRRAKNAYNLISAELPAFGELVEIRAVEHGRKDHFASRQPDAWFGPCGFQVPLQSQRFNHIRIIPDEYRHEGGRESGYAGKALAFEDVSYGEYLLVRSKPHKQRAVAGVNKFHKPEKKSPRASPW
jgi:hypothetical protein